MRKTYKNHIEIINTTSKKNLRIRYLDKKQKYVKTNEDWYPNFDDDTIEVTFHHSKYDYDYRITIWGSDDFGMEKICKNRLEALELYNKIIDYITKKELMNLGFINA